MQRALMCSTIALLLCPHLLAQQRVGESADAQHKQAEASSSTFVTIPRGTEVELMALETVSTETARKGQMVRFAVARDVVVNGEVVLHAGTPVNAKLYSFSKAVPGRRDGMMKLVMDAVIVNGRKIWIAACNAECLQKQSEQSKHRISKTGKDVAMAVVAAPLLPALVAMEVADSVHEKKSRSAAGTVQPTEAAVLPACYKVRRWVQHEVKVERNGVSDAAGKADGESMKACAQYGDGQPPHDEKVTNGMKVWFD